jgi:eukaryotic-like serine/threonine-protein kinase
MTIRQPETPEHASEMPQQDKPGASATTTAPLTLGSEASASTTSSEETSASFKDKPTIVDADPSPSNAIISAPGRREASEIELAGATSHAPTELALELEPLSKGSRQTVQLRKVTATQESEAGANGEEEEPAPRRAETYVGYIIDGRYHVEAIIAQGGMGVVYRGRHRLIDKAVAIKVLRPELADNREITQRFLTEAQAASSIGNEHIVDITDYGELPDGATYIVMEYLEGEALGQAIERAKDLIPVPEILAISRQVCDGLQHAHNAGIVHRDLKPDNIFLTHRGKQERFVKILDFGIAKVASSQNQLTRAGRIFGTPHYMSPEQARGEELDNRADIYSMGVILYEMLSGRLPFEGENPLGILTQHMYTEPRPLHELCGMTRVSVGLEAIVSKCLLKEPWQRYSSMSELGMDLERVEQGDEPIAINDLKRLSVSPPAMKERLSRGGRRRGRGWLWFVPLIGIVGALTYAIPRRQELLALWEQYGPGVELMPTDETEITPDHNSVALVLSPVDAHVFRGKQDLGLMPITVRIKEGQHVRLSVQRDGYVSQEVELDGSEDRKVVELVPLAGSGGVAAPRVVHPVPTGKARIITIDDEPVVHAPPPIVLADPDAGVGPPQLRPGKRKTKAQRDAGAPKRPRRVGPPAINDIFAPTPPAEPPPVLIPEPPATALRPPATEGPAPGPAPTGSSPLAPQSNRTPSDLPDEQPLAPSELQLLPAPDATQ